MDSPAAAALDRQVLAETTRAIAGGELAGVIALPGGASLRRYHRLVVEGGRVPTLMLMELRGDGKPEEVTRDAGGGELPFVDVQRYLAAGGLPVPELHHYDRTRGLLYLEDLGDATLESVVRAAPPAVRAAWYLRAIDLLIEFQRYTAAPPVAAGTAAHARRFDYDLLRWELDHFREWLLEAGRGVVLRAEDRAALDADFDRLARALADAPALLVHRDFQSRNLMVQGERLRLLDFQDALVGPAPYDLVALLRDSYVELGAEELDRLLDAYIDRSGRAGAREAFRRLFFLQAVQRKLKDAGRFVYIDRVKHNPTFLPSIPASLRYVRDALARLPELAPLRGRLAAHLPEIES